MIRRIPLPWLHSYVLLSVMAFLLVEAAQWQGMPLPIWVHGHLNDLLCVPIVALISLHGTWLIKGDRSLRASNSHILALVLLFSVYFEAYLPEVNPRYVRDPIDVACYALGGMLFLFLQGLESERVSEC